VEGKIVITLTPVNNDILPQLLHEVRALLVDRLNSWYFHGDGNKLVQYKAIVEISTAKEEPSAPQGGIND